jgi:hypothetical protein
MKDDVREKVCKAFKVSEKTCEKYRSLYETVFEPRMKILYLAHVASAIEYAINCESIKKYKERASKDGVADTDIKLFKILFIPYKNLHKKATVRHTSFGSIICYNPNFADKEVRILIAHELGHIVNFHYLHCPDTQNNANTFSYFAINGRNEFYKNDSKNFIYSSEFEIIDAISAICPITKGEEYDTAHEVHCGKTGSA